MKKVALITGITGQDGAYLAELLLGKGYVVHGIKRRASSFNTARIDHLYHDPHEEGVRFFLHHGDVTDSSNLIHLIQKIQPDEIYNLAAMSHVAVSFESPEYTADVDAIGPLRILEAIRILRKKKPHRSTPGRLTQLPSFMRTGLPSTIARHTGYTLVTGFFSITNRRYVERILSPER
jgi:GDPmannose 4,6-dehydratase